MQYLTQMLRKVDIVVEVDELLQEREEAAAGAESLGSLELPQVWRLPRFFLVAPVLLKRSLKIPMLPASSVTGTNVCWSPGWRSAVPDMPNYRLLLLPWF